MNRILTIVKGAVVLVVLTYGLWVGYRWTAMRQYVPHDKALLVVAKYGKPLPPDRIVVPRGQTSIAWLSVVALGAMVLMAWTGARYAGPYRASHNRGRPRLDVSEANVRSTTALESVDASGIVGGRLRPAVCSVKSSRTSCRLSSGVVGAVVSCCWSTWPAGWTGDAAWSVP